MLSIAICDDDKMELSQTEDIIRSCLDRNRIQYTIHIFSSPDNLLYEIGDHRLSDVYVLDVSMPVKKWFLRGRRNSKA